jgi:hypothetical protein
MMEDTMKRNVVGTSLMLITLAALLATLEPAAHAAHCSTATVAGTWGFTLSGTLILPSGAVPGAAIGRAVADNDGNLTGTEARSVGGGYGDETFTGSWTVNPDCTASMTANFYEEGQLVRTSVLTIVFDDNSKEARMVQKSLTLPNGAQVPVVLTLEGRKQ